MKKILVSFIGAIVFAVCLGAQTGELPGGDNTAVDMNGTGIVNENYVLNASWKKCALQGYGRLAAVTPWTLTYSFYDPATSGAIYYPNSPNGLHIPANATWNHVAFSPAAKASIIAALDIAELSVYRDFLEVADTPTSWGQIRFFSVNESIGSWGSVDKLPNGDTGLDGLSDVFIRSVYDVPSTVDWRGYNDVAARIQGGLPARQGLTNILHEVGHALGLKHPFENAIGVHPERPDCFFPDGNDPNQHAGAPPRFPTTPFPTVTPPTGSLFCPYINGAYGYNADSSLYSVMTYRWRQLCNTALPAESNYGLFDKPVLKDLYYYNNGA